MQDYLYYSCVLFPLKLCLSAHFRVEQSDVAQWGRWDQWTECLFEGQSKHKQHTVALPGFLWVSVVTRWNCHWKALILLASLPNTHTWSSCGSSKLATCFALWMKVEKTREKNLSVFHVNFLYPWHLSYAELKTERYFMQFVSAVFQKSVLTDNIVTKDLRLHKNAVCKKKNTIII